MLELIGNHTLTQTNPKLVDYALFISLPPGCVDPFPLDG